MSKRRAVITGMGVVSPLGCDLDSFWHRLTNGESGIRPIHSFDATDYPSRIGGEVSEFDASAFLDPKERRRMDIYTQYAMAAAQMAIADSGLDLENEDTERIGALVGSGIGGLQTLQEQHAKMIHKGPSRCSPFMIPQMISNIASGLIAIRYNLQGPNFCVVSACATAAHSIGTAQRMIERGDSDVMLAGGAEGAICELGVAGFANMKALSTRNDEPQRASRPWDRDRDGFVMADGSAIMVVEEYERAKARGAEIYCEVAGFGATCDAFHMTAPMDSGYGAARAMRDSIKDAGMNPEDVDYINAHGTSTPKGDGIESKAVKTALGVDIASKVMISSSKSMTGHTLGAAGGIETAVCALAIKNNVVPPTINLENPSPDCDLDYVPNEAREAEIKICLNNSFGFGGHNACLLLAEV
jgi:3-oxoacyl-[acyl-carrier-protein] synthase II